MNTLFSDTKYIFIKSLRSLKHILIKCEQEMDEKNLSEDEILHSKLTEDMFDLTRQVQITSDNAKGAIARLSQIEAPKFEDTERSFAELITRIENTIHFLESVSDTQLLGTEAHIVLPYFPDQYQLADEYVKNYALANFFFHFNMAYAILRQKGFSLGKADYINGLQLYNME